MSKFKILHSRRGFLAGTISTTVAATIPTAVAKTMPTTVPGALKLNPILDIGLSLADDEILFQHPLSRVTLRNSKGVPLRTTIGSGPTVIRNACKSYVKLIYASNGVTCGGIAPKFATEEFMDFFYNNTKTALLKLQGMGNHFPKLYDYNDKKRTIVMEDAGNDLMLYAKSNPLPVEAILKAMRNIGSALQKASMFKLNHSTSNLCINNKGEIKAIDFKYATSRPGNLEEEIKSYFKIAKKLGPSVPEIMKEFINDQDPRLVSSLYKKAKRQIV